MKKILKKLLCLVMVAMVLVATSTTIFVSAYDNLVTNPGFETGSSASASQFNFTDWTSTGCTTAPTVTRTITRDGTTGNFKSGTYSAKILDTDTALVIAPRLSRYVSVDPTKSYTFKYWVKSANATRVTALQYDNGSTNTGATINIDTSASASAFTEVSITFSPSGTDTPVGAAKSTSSGGNMKLQTSTTRLLIQLWSVNNTGAVNITGTAWYDDVSLTQFDPSMTTPTYNKTTGAVGVNINNYYLNAQSPTAIVAQYKLIDGPNVTTAPGWTFNGTGTNVTFLRDNTTKNSGTYGLKIADNSTLLAARAVQANVPIDPTKSYTFKYWVKSANATRVSVLQYDNNTPQNNTGATIHIDTSASASDFTEVSITLSPSGTDTPLPTPQIVASGANMKLQTNTTRLYIQLWSSTNTGIAATGTAYYDDVSLTDDANPTVTLITNGGYELGDLHFQAYKTQTPSLVAGSNSITFDAFGASDINTFVKVFLWDNLTSMKPLASAVQSQ